VNSTDLWLPANRGKLRPKAQTGKACLRLPAVIAGVWPGHTSIQTWCRAARPYKPPTNRGLFKFTPLPRSTCMYMKSRDNDPPRAVRQSSPLALASWNPGLRLYEISSVVPAGRHTGIHPYYSGPNPWMESVSFGPIPSWDPATVGLVARVFSTTALRYIKTKRIRAREP